MAPLKDGRVTRNQHMINVQPQMQQKRSNTVKEILLPTWLPTGLPVHHLSLSFTCNHVQQRLSEVVSDAAVTDYLISKDDKTEVVDVLNIILLHIHTILWTKYKKENVRITPDICSYVYVVNTIVAIQYCVLVIQLKGSTLGGGVCSPMLSHQNWHVYFLQQMTACLIS